MKLHSDPASSVYVYSVCIRIGEAPCQVIMLLASGTSLGQPWTYWKGNTVTHRNTRIEVPKVEYFSIQVFGVV